MITFIRIKNTIKIYVFSATKLFLGFKRAAKK